MKLRMNGISNKHLIDLVIQVYKYSYKNKKSIQVLKYTSDIITVYNLISCTKAPSICYQI